MTQSRAGLAFNIVFPLLAVMLPVLGSLSDHADREAVLASNLLLTGAVLVVLLLGQDATMATLGVVLLGLGFMGRRDAGPVNGRLLRRRTGHWVRPHGQCPCFVAHLGASSPEPSPSRLDGCLPTDWSSVCWH